MHDPIRWGIIGCGDVCEVKSGPGFYKASHSALVAVMRRDGAKAADFAARHGVARSYDDAQKLIDDPQVDAVYIATPPGSHRDYALRVASAGKPCYVEKPMARNARECREMIDAFDAAGVPLYVGYYRRMLPRFVQVREMLQAGKLGTITGVNYRNSRPFKPGPTDAWRMSAAESGGGNFLDVGSHLLDLVDHLIGPLAGACGHAAGYSEHLVEDCVTVSAQLPGRAIFSGHWNFASCTNEDRLEITGTRGRVAMSCFGSEPIEVLIDGERSTLDGSLPQHVHQPVIQTIVDELLGRGTCPSTGRSALRTSEVMDAALSEYYQGRDDDFWTRERTWKHPKNG